MLNFSKVSLCSTLIFFQLPTVRQEMDLNKSCTLWQWSSWAIPIYWEIWWEKDMWKLPKCMWETCDAWKCDNFFSCYFHFGCMFLFGFDSQNWRKIFPEPSREIWKVLRLIFTSKFRFVKVCPILTSWKLSELLLSLVCI